MHIFLFGMTAVRRRRMVQRITVQTATVTDNLDGTLSVKWSTGTKKEIHFYNRYKKKTVTPNPSGKHGGKADNNNIGPFTGDDSNADLYLGLMGASAAILAALAGSRKKRKL